MGRRSGWSFRSSLRTCSGRGGGGGEQDYLMYMLSLSSTLGDCFNNYRPKGQFLHVHEQHIDREL